MHWTVVQQSAYRPGCPKPACVTLYLSPQVLTAVEDYGAVSSSLAEQGLKIQPEASGLVYTPMVQQVGMVLGAVIGSVKLQR